MNRQPPVVLLHIAGPYRSQHEMLSGVISEAATLRGWTLANCWAAIGSQQDLHNAIAWYGANAAIMLEMPLPVADWLYEEGIPSVMLRHRDKRIPSVCVDDRAVGALACDHLIATGVPHLAQLLQFTGWGRDRKSGFIDRATKLGRTVISADAMQMSEHDSPRLTAWLTSLPKPCGLFCGNDHTAAEVIRNCRRSGILVPEELLVLGVDDEPTLCHQGTPSLSSVSIPWETMGREAVRLLAHRLSRPSAAPAFREFPPSGVTVRASTDMLAVDDELVRRAVRLIRERIGSDICIKDLLRELRCSRTVLEERFRVSLGCSPFAEIRRTRLAVARRLQARGDLTVTQIAREAGFPSPAALRRALRQLG